MKEPKFKCTKGDTVLILVGARKGELGTVDSVIPYDGIDNRNLVKFDDCESSNPYMDIELEVVVHSEKHKIDPVKALVLVIVILFMLCMVSINKYIETEKELERNYKPDTVNKVEILSDTVGKIPSK